MVAEFRCASCNAFYEIHSYDESLLECDIECPCCGSPDHIYESFDKYNNPKILELSEKIAHLEKRIAMLEGEEDLIEH